MAGKTKKQTGKTILKWTVLAALGCYVVLAAVWAHGEAMKNACHDIEVEIMDRGENSTADSVTVKGVKAEIAAYPGKILGVRREVLDTKAIESYLSAFSNFEDVECVITPDGTLKVRVTPMVPALRVFDSGKSFYINKDGKVIESKASFFVDVPVVSGKFNESFTPRDVLPLVRFVENDSILKNLIGMIHAPDKDNLLLIPRIQGHVVNFGDTTHLAEKRLALLTAYRKIMPYKGWDEYDTISVKFRGQIVASRRNKNRRDHGGVYEDGPDIEEDNLQAMSTAD